MRKEMDFVATKGRDQGKHFHITEMSAANAEAWAAQALFAVMNAGVEMPDGAGLADLMENWQGALARVKYQDAKPLLDEMMTCVKAIPTPSQPNIMRPLIDEDIEEVATRIQLRKAVLDLHTEFLKNASA